MLVALLCSFAASGSMQTSLAPLRLACGPGARSRLLVMELLPQIRIKLALGKIARACADLAAQVCTRPLTTGGGADGAVEQRAPSLWKKRAAMPSPCTRPMVPA